MNGTELAPPQIAVDLLFVNLSHNLESTSKNLTTLWSQIFNSIDVGLRPRNPTNLDSAQSLSLKSPTKDKGQKTKD